MLRTWPVRLVAIALTLSVRSFQVPATPFTLACPPSLPSVPTSRATRVTSDANEASCSTIVFTTLPMRRNSPRSGRPSISTDIALRKVALGDGADHARDLGGRLDHVVDQLVDRANRGLPAAARVLDAAALGDLAFLADDLGEALEFLRHLLVEGDDFVEQAGDLAIDPVHVLGQADAKIAPSQRPESTDELAAIDKVPLGLYVHSYSPVGFHSPRPVTNVQPPGCTAFTLSR